MPRSTLLPRLDEIRPIKIHGRVCRAVGLTIEGTGPVSSIGQRCQIFSPAGDHVEAEVVGFRDNRVLVMPLGEESQTAPESEMLRCRWRLTADPGEARTMSRAARCAHPGGLG